VRYRYRDRERGRETEGKVERLRAKRKTRDGSFHLSGNKRRRSSAEQWCLSDPVTDSLQFIRGWPIQGMNAENEH
jgi:hypothetical protein